jgi:hypothetical protein
VKNHYSTGQILSPAGRFAETALPSQAHAAISECVMTYLGALLKRLNRQKTPIAPLTAALVLRPAAPVVVRAADTAELQKQTI